MFPSSYSGREVLEKIRGIWGFRSWFSGAGDVEIIMFFMALMLFIVGIPVGERYNQVWVPSEELLSAMDPRGIEEMAHEVLRYLFTML